MILASKKCVLVPGPTQWTCESPSSVCPWRGRTDSWCRSRVAAASPPLKMEFIIIYNLIASTSSPNNGLLELVGRDELEGGLHPHLHPGTWN